MRFIKDYFGIHAIQERQQRGILLPVVQGEPSLFRSRHAYLSNHNHLFSKEPNFLEKLKRGITGKKNSVLLWLVNKSFSESTLKYISK